MLLESQLITARDCWGKEFKDFPAFWRGSRASISPKFPSELRIAESPVIRARVNHGRWITDCPFCSGSEAVWLEEPSLFFCFSCQNKAVGGHLVRVVIPRNYIRIEDILLVRHPINRNWAGETLSTLKSENTRMGVA